MMTPILLTLGLSAFVMLRAVIVWAVNQHRIDDANRQRINDGAGEIPELLNYYDCVRGELGMMFDVRCWTYRQFYPDGLNA